MGESGASIIFESLVLVAGAGIALYVGWLVYRRSPISSDLLRRTSYTKNLARPLPEYALASPAYARHLAELTSSGTAAELNDEIQRATLRRDGNPVEVFVSLQDGIDEPILGTVTDRSRGGLCLRVSESVPPTSLLKVRATHAPEGSPWVQLDVRRCEKQGDHWELGCRFTEDQPWNVLLLFG